MTNTGTSSVTFTITSNNYTTEGPWTYKVAAGATVNTYFSAVANTNGWYDFTITISGDTSWTRRYTGHLENGSASITG
jgi:phospholipase C